MEFFQIRYFVAAAQLLHFAQAAERLGVTQPALSRGIRNLENEFGVRFFERSNKRRIALTSAGAAFLPEAEKLLRQLAVAERSATEASEGLRGRLSIGALSSTLGRREFLASATEMRRRYPLVRLEIIDDNSRGLTGRMLARSIDIAVTRAAPELVADGEFSCRELYRDELLLVLPRDHPLAARRGIAVGDLRGERIVPVPEVTSPALHRYVESFCETEGGFHPIVTDECSSSFTALRLVEYGGGVTFVPQSYEGLFSDHLCYRRLQGFRPELPVYCIVGRGAFSAAMRNFLRILFRRFHGEAAGEGEPEFR